MSTFVFTHKERLPEQAEKAVRKVGLEVLNDTVRLCPVDLGTLAQSYTMVADHDANSATARIGTNVFYAPFVEFGHGVIKPVRAKMLRWIGKDGQPVFARSVGPQPPRPHLREALRRAKARYS